MISIVIPTISGREESLAGVLDAYEKTTGIEKEIIVMLDRPSWPKACNEGYEQSNGEIIHFGADDLEPLPDWWRNPLAWLQEHDELPAPRVWDYRQEGQYMNLEDGGDGDIPHFTRVPILTRSQYERIGPWPLIDYYADVWLSEKARTLGIETRMVFGYDFVHHWSQIGRVDSRETLDKAGAKLAMLRQEM
jgi:hypothetical protein